MPYRHADDVDRIRQRVALWQGCRRGELTNLVFSRGAASQTDDTRKVRAAEVSLRREMCACRGVMAPSVGHVKGQRYQDHGTRLN
jgi:hypothetical protein